MNTVKLTALSLVLASLLLSCQSPKQTEKDSNIETPPVVTTLESSIQTKCKSPRPEVCAKVYDPVCAASDTGVRCITTPCSSTENVTKSNACTACSDEKVFSYIEGACK